MAELFDKLCDLGLSELSKTAAPRDFSRQKPQSQAGIFRRVLCRQCNQRAAVEAFGVTKMEKYLRCRELSYVFGLERTQRLDQMVR